MCFFTRAEQILTMRLRQWFNSDVDFALKAKMILSLAYIPSEHIDEAVDLLYDDLPSELQKLLNWFEDN